MLDKDQIQAVEALTGNDGWKFILSYMDSKIAEMNAQDYSSTRPEDIAVEALARQHTEKRIREIFRELELLKDVQPKGRAVDRMI